MEDSNADKNMLILTKNSIVGGNPAIENKVVVNTKAMEGFFNVLKSKLAKKKGFTYEELCESNENVLKEIPQKTY